MQGKQEGGGPQGCLSALPAPGQGEMGQQKTFWEKCQTGTQHCWRWSDSVILGAMSSGEMTTFLGCVL